MEDLTSGSLKKTVIRLVLPVIIGMFGMVVFNFTDTAYVAQLGGIQLAAMSFTFPVIGIVLAVSIGPGIGAASAISRAAGNMQDIKRLTTDTLILSGIIVIIGSIVGLLTIDPLFGLIGATDEAMPYIKEYMTIWYIGMPMIVISVIGNNIVRALGDTKTPGIITAIAAVLNLILDPFLIFGIGPFPQLGVAGAAITTIASRFLTFAAMLYILGKRERLISLKGATLKKIFNSFGRVLFVGVPSSFIRAMNSVGAYIITGLLAIYGNEVVAGYGAGIKTESVIFCVINALAVVTISVLGQNFGCGRIDRVKKGFRTILLFNAIYGAIVYCITFFAAPYIAMLFSTEPAIQQTTAIYIRISFSALIFRGAFEICGFAFNAVGKPITGVFVSLLQMFVLYIPLSYLLRMLFNENGIFIALALSYLISSIVGYICFMRFLRKECVLNEGQTTTQ